MKKSAPVRDLPYRQSKDREMAEVWPPESATAPVGAVSTATVDAGRRRVDFCNGLLGTTLCTPCRLGIRARPWVGGFGRDVWDRFGVLIGTKSDGGLVPIWRRRHENRSSAMDWPYPLREAPFKCACSVCGRLPKHGHPEVILCRSELRCSAAQLGHWGNYLVADSHPARIDIPVALQDPRDHGISG